MFKYFLLLFVTVPLLELYVLIEVGRGIGGIYTIAICLLTAAVGGVLVRFQGILTLLDAQKCMARGEVPAAHLFHGLMLAVSGLLLFTPGLITDALGFLLLVPMVRHLITAYILRSRRAQQGHRRSSQGDVIDVEVVREPEKPRDDPRIY